MSEEMQIDIADEQVDAIRIANLLLDRPYADPDDDLRMLSRQLLRRHEELAALQAENANLLKIAGYAKHMDNCLVMSVRICTCGLAAALDAALKDRP